jgi:hypothetical protein
VNTHPALAAVQVVEVGAETAAHAA